MKVDFSPVRHVRFAVERHGGARTHRWRIWLVSKDEARAEKFARLAADRICRGGIRLVRYVHDGAGCELERSELWSVAMPRIRSRR